MRRPGTNTRDYGRLVRHIVGLGYEDFLDHVEVLNQLILSGDPRRRLAVEREGGIVRFWQDSRIRCLLSFHHFSADAATLGDREIAEMEEAVLQHLEAEPLLPLLRFVHNRDARSRAFREGIERLTRKLQQGGAVERVEVRDVRWLLETAFQSMATYLESRAGDLAGSGRIPQREDGPGTFSSIEEVPYIWRELVADQYELRTVSAPEMRVEDPVSVLRGLDRRHRTLLLGEFGFGKTTIALRRADSDSTRVFFVPAARIDKEVKGSKDLLTRCLDLDVLFDGVEERWLPLCRRLVRNAAEGFFWDPDMADLLILDGLDESAYLDQDGSLQRLLNSLWQVEVPVVLTMRTEYWKQHESRFALAFGEPASHGEKRFHHVSCVELLAWEPEQISEFLQRYLSTLEEETAQRRLDDLVGSLTDGRFEELYGDVPRRPLFLRFIADRVAREGMPEERQGRARVLRDGVRFKILRDLQAPREQGGHGRAPVRAGSASPEEVVQLAWIAMVAAARRMAKLNGAQLELEASVPWDEVRASRPELAEISDPANLYLHSLLLPTTVRRGYEPQRVQFAHRTFQEFFLAWGLLEETPTSSGSSLLPETVSGWVRDLQSEGLVAERSIGSTRAGLSIPRGGSDLPDLNLRVTRGPQLADGRWSVRYRLGASDSEVGINDKEFEKILGGSLDGFIRGALREVESGFRSRNWSRDELKARTEALGDLFWRVLIPEELATILWELRSGEADRCPRSLLIQSDLPWIPWEILRLGRTTSRGFEAGPFLGEAFWLSKWLSGWSLRRRLSWSCVGLVIPSSSGLPALQDERAMLEAYDRPPARRVETVHASWMAVRDACAAARYDGLHFAGHGGADLQDPERSWIELEEDELQVGHLTGPFENLGQRHPLVFFNACRTAQDGFTLGSLGGWAQRFVEMGSGAFVGPYWKVPDRLACRFAQAFYRNLVRGDVLAQAAHRARIELRDETEGHPAYLAYTVFGHPLAALDPVEGAEASPDEDG